MAPHVASALDPHPQERTIGRWLLLLSLGAIAYITLLPNDGSRSAGLTKLSCLVCGDFGGVDVLLNTVLFVPFGLALGLMRVPWPRVVVMALIVTAGIELSQLTIISGRDASLSDLLTNTAGAALGGWFAPHWRRWLLPDPATARQLCAALLIGWVLTRLSTAWLLRPSFPESRWYGQVAPKDVYPADFLGTVLRADLAQVPATSAEMPELRAAFRSREIDVDAVVTGAIPTRSLASVLSVLDEHRSEVVLLGQEQDAARLRFRLRTADLRFRTPSLRLEHALVDTPGEQTRLTGRLAPGTLTLTSGSAERRFSSTLALSPGLGWALLLPFDVGLTPRAAMLGTAACTGAAMLVIGLLAGLARPDRPLVAILASGAAAAIGLSVPLVVFPEATLELTELLAALLGASQGALMGVLMGASRGASRGALAGALAGATHGARRATAPPN